MIAYQFDQCFNDPLIINGCNTQGLARALPLPREWHDRKDPELLALALPAGNPVITTDWAMPEDNARHIPDYHPGIIAVRYSIYATPRVNQTMSTRGGARILMGFKRVFPNWNQTNVSNCILYISEADIEVAVMRAGRLSHIDFAFFTEAGDWQSRIAQAITMLAGSAGCKALANLPATPPPSA